MRSDLRPMNLDNAEECAFDRVSDRAQERKAQNPWQVIGDSGSDK